MKKLYLLLTLGVLGAFFACSKPKNTSKNTHKDLFILGVSPDYPPFEFKRNGVTVGLDIDIAEAVFAKLGYRLQVQDMEFSGLIPSLKSGRIDLAMSSLTITPNRSQSVDFSSPYYYPKFALLYQGCKNYISLEEFESMSIGAQTGSTMEAYLKERQKTGLPITIVSLGNNNDLVQDLKVGRLAGVLLEDAQGYAFTVANPELKFLLLGKTAEGGFAAAFKKKDKLRDAFDQALMELQKEGVTEEIINKWLQRND